jgi:hypothetical protein
MKTYRLLYWFVVATLLCSGVWSQTTYAAQPDVSSPVEESGEVPPGQRIGAPQVLEIAPQLEERDLATETQPREIPPETPARSVERTELPATEQAARTVEQLPQQGEYVRPGEDVRSIAGQRNYLGVLYATAEEGPVGVKVLDVVPGSPAERAGFSGANRPSEGQSTLIKAAIVVLAMSPAGPFAIPLAIAHDMYMTKQSPGDVIVAINNQPVHNAQEFSEAMRRYQPKETVAFSVLRGGKPMQISVQLEEEPG